MKIAIIDYDKVLATREFIQKEYSGVPIPERSYFILMSPRTGSNLLATHLQNINFGNPFEAFHFNKAEIQRLYGWDIDFSDPVAYIQKTINFLTVEGVFGMKLNWLQLHTFLKTSRQLTNAHDITLTDKEVIEVFFPKALFIYMKRLGKVKQAVSFSKGKQTGIWMERAGQDQSYKKYIMPPKYDRAHIEGCLEELLAYDVAWENYLARNQVAYLELWYEALAKDFIMEMGRVYKYLGINQKEIPEPIVKKQANTKSFDWVNRFEDETPWLKDNTIEKSLEEGDFKTAFIHRSMMIIHQKEERSWLAMPANRFKSSRKFIFNVKRKLSSFFRMS